MSRGIGRNDKDKAERIAALLRSGLTVGQIVARGVASASYVSLVRANMQAGLPLAANTKKRKQLNAAG